MKPIASVATSSQDVDGEGAPKEVPKEEVTSADASSLTNGSLASSASRVGKHRAAYTSNGYARLEAYVPNETQQFISQLRVASHASKSDVVSALVELGAKTLQATYGASITQNSIDNPIADFFKRRSTNNKKEDSNEQ